MNSIILLLFVLIKIYFIDANTQINETNPLINDGIIDGSLYRNSAENYEVWNNFSLNMIYFA